MRYASINHQAPKKLLILDATARRNTLANAMELVDVARRKVDTDYIDAKSQ